MLGHTEGTDRLSPETAGVADRPVSGPMVLNISIRESPESREGSRVASKKSRTYGMEFRKMTALETERRESPAAALSAGGFEGQRCPRSRTGALIES